MKKLLRQTARSTLKKTEPNSLHLQSYLLSTRLINSQIFSNASHMCVFSPMSHEVQVLNVLYNGLQDEKSCYVPIVESKTQMTMIRVESWDDYRYNFEKKGKYSIWEPKSVESRARLFDDLSKSLDAKLLILMPGLAFDADGNRLGYGGGYYDRFLKQVSQLIDSDRVLTVALALNEQIVDHVPTTIEDVPVDLLLSPNGVVHLSDRASQGDNALLKPRTSNMFDTTLGNQNTPFIRNPGQLISHNFDLLSILATETELSGDIGITSSIDSFPSRPTSEPRMFV